MLSFEVAAMLCIATFAFGMGMGVFAVDMMRRAHSVPMHDPIEHIDEEPDTATVELKQKLAEHMLFGRFGRG